MLNSVQLVGRLTADPTSSPTSSGSVCRFSIAVDRRGSDTPDFIDITTFAKLAETCQRYLTKGRLVAITARLRQNKWQDKTTGESRSRLEVIANEVSFLDSKKPNEPTSATHDEGDAEPVFEDEPF
jgi:single-strand DNA-binding protein